MVDLHTLHFRPFGASVVHTKSGDLLVRDLDRVAQEFDLNAQAEAPGERPRLEIASSAFLLYDRNSSTNIPPELADNWNWARFTQQIVHTSADAPGARSRDAATFGSDAGCQSCVSRCRGLTGNYRNH